MKKITQCFIPTDTLLNLASGFKIIHATYDFNLWSMSLHIEEDANSVIKDAWEFSRKYDNTLIEDDWIHVASFSREDYYQVHYYMRRVR